MTVNATLPFAVGSESVPTLAGAATFASASDAVSATHDGALLSRAVEVDMAAVTARALKWERDGDGQQADKLMRRALASAAPNSSADIAAEYEHQVDAWQGGITDHDRKAQPAQANKTRTRRA